VKVPAIQTGLPNVQTQGLGTGLPNTNLNLPSGSLPGTNSLSQLNGVANAPSQELNKLTSTGALGAGEKELSQITNQAKGFSSDLKNISTGDLDKTKQIPQTLENKAMQMGDMKEFQTETTQLNQYKTMAGQAADPEAAKKLALQELEKKAIDHFAGEGTDPSGRHESDEQV